MKQILIAFLLCSATIISGQGINQLTFPSSPNTIRKGSPEKAIGLALLTNGALFLTLGAISKDSVHILFGETEKNRAKKAFFIMGGISVLSSIPLFIIAASKQRKAMRLSLKNETVMYPDLQKWKNWPVPSLSFKISI